MQEDYEAIYMGPEFRLEVRYSQIMTFFFITMIYSSGMPALYFISVFQYFSMYWVDKFLFVRMYRTPPRYGNELAEKSRDIMQISILVHMAFGLYMFSNSSILTTSGGVGFSIASLTEAASGDGGSLLSAKRLGQPHVVLYLVIYMIIGGVFVFIKVVNAFFPSFWSKLACFLRLCQKQIDKLKAEKYLVETEEAYSNNIYREMTIEDLNREFDKTQLELDDYKGTLEAGLIKKEHKAVEYMLKRYEKKQLTIKEMLNRWLRQAYINQVSDVADAFNKLFKIRKGDPSHRLKTLYSYDIKDNTLFKKT